MNEFDKRIQLLAEEIAAARFKVDTALRSTIVFYIILILLVTGYTLYIGAQMRELATPKTVATMLSNSLLTRMPDIQKQLVSQAKIQAPIMAGKTIDFAERAIPQIEVFAKTQIDATVESLVDKAFTQMMPQLVESIKGNFDEISKHKNLVTDKKTAESIADLLSGKIAEQLDGVINDSFYKRLFELQKEVDALAQKAPGKMTMREAAEKQVIINWLYLVENADPGQSPMVEVMRVISDMQFKLLKKQ